MEAIDQAAAESDARMERMDHVAVLHGEITAATRAFLRAVAESDRHRARAETGSAPCAARREAPRAAGLGRSAGIVLTEKLQRRLRHQSRLGQHRRARGDQDLGPRERDCLDGDIRVPDRAFSRS